MFGSFQFGAIMNKTIVDILLQDFLWTYALVYLRYMLRSAL